LDRFTGHFPEQLLLDGAHYPGFISLFDQFMFQLLSSRLPAHSGSVNALRGLREVMKINGIKNDAALWYVLSHVVICLRAKSHRLSTTIELGPCAIRYRAPFYIRMIDQLRFAFLQLAV